LRANDAAALSDHFTRSIEPSPVGSAGAVTPPDDAPGRLIFPVHEGNRWRYRRDAVVRQIIRGIELPPYERHQVYEEVILWSLASPFGTFFDLRDPRGSFFETPTYRQDATGLYLRYSPFVASATSDPTTAPYPYDRFTVLSYPPHVGARWLGRLGEEWVVEGVEVMDLPQGRTVAYRLATVQDSWWSRRWYGPCGRVRSEDYYENPVIESGQVVGKLMVHAVEVLEEVELFDCERCTLCRR
jgi:hypothetical protein